MIRRSWPYLSITAGSLMAGGACISLAVLGGLPPLMTTPYTAVGVAVGVVAVVVGALVLLAVGGAFRPRQPKNHPVRVRDAVTSNDRRRGVDRVRSSARCARPRGDQVAGPRGTNGGGPAAHNIDATEVLPAVDDGEASTAVFTLPLPAVALTGGGHQWAGRADSPRGAGRPTTSSVHRSRGGCGRTAAASALRTGVEAAAHKPAQAPTRGGAARMTVAAPASGNSGAATTLTLPSAANPQPAGVPQRAYHRSAARGDAAHAVTRLAGVGRPTPPTTWTGGTAVNSAALDETFHR